MTRIYERFLTADGIEKVRLRCLHDQAEPVTLFTGETIACICIDCLDQLPADYIDNQRIIAHHTAICTHASVVDLYALGERGVQRVCGYCGTTLE